MRLIDEKTIDDLVSSLGLKFMPEEKRKETLNGVLELISKRAGLRIMENFTEEEIAKFNEIPEENLEEIESFMITKNPGAKIIFEEEKEKVKEELLNSTP